MKHKISHYGSEIFFWPSPILKLNNSLHNKEAIFRIRSPLLAIIHYWLIFMIDFTSLIILITTFHTFLVTDDMVSTEGLHFCHHLKFILVWQNQNYNPQFLKLFIHKNKEFNSILQQILDDPMKILCIMSTCGPEVADPCCNLLCTL